MSKIDEHIDHIEDYARHVTNHIEENFLAEERRRLVDSITDFIYAVVEQHPNNQQLLDIKNKVENFYGNPSFSMTPANVARLSNGPVKGCNDVDCCYSWECQDISGIWELYQEARNILKDVTAPK